MAQRSMHVNLTSKLFPINFREMPSSVIFDDGSEQNRRLLTGFSGQEPVQSYGLCQAYHLQNVLPITRGYSSAHFLPQINPPVGSAALFDDVFVLADNAGNTALYSPAGGQNMVYRPQVDNWITDPGNVSPNNVSVAYLKGETYICYPGVGLYVYDHQTNALELQVVGGITFTNILGVAAAGSSLILYTKDAIYWSSVTAPLDFVPSQASGAGTTSVLALRGTIVTIKSMGDGFVIYTSQNAVVAQATGNIAFPWAYSEIQNSVGIQQANHVAAYSSSASHVAWTNGGFMEISARGAQPIWPELGEGISRGYISRSTTEGYPLLVQSDDLRVKLNAVGSEYLLISVATQDSGNFDVAYVYDLKLARWGKLDVPHVDFFQFAAPAFTSVKTYDELALEYPQYQNMYGKTYEEVSTPAGVRPTAPGKTLGVVSPDGSVHSVVLATSAFPNIATSENPNGIITANAKLPTMLLGRFKLARSQGFRLEFFNVESVVNADFFAYGHDYVGDRINIARNVTPHKAIPGRQYARVVGDSVSIGMRGVFTCTDMTIFGATAGRRNLPNKGRRGRVVVNGVPVVVGGLAATYSRT